MIYMNRGSMENAIRAVLFDVDGTLADTERDGHRPAFNTAFRESGLDWEWDVDLYGKLLAITGGKERILHFMETCTPDELNRDDLGAWIAHLHKVKTKHYVALLENGGIPLRPGVARLIEHLRHKNIKIAIATTTTPENVTALLQSTLGADSPGWFDVIGAGDVVPGKKPKPDIYHWVLDHLGLSARQCIAVEGSENGLKAALAAGLETLVTVNSYTRCQDFTGASLILSDLGEPLQPFTVLGGVNAHALHSGRVDLDLLLKLKSSNSVAEGYG